MVVSLGNAFSLESLYEEMKGIGPNVYGGAVKATSPTFAPAPSGMPSLLAQWLEATNRQLYTHQAECVEASLVHKSFVLVTPTSSGKTLSFNLATLSHLVDGQSTALYLYPTKALAEDQLQTLQGIDDALHLGLNPRRYDRDTPQADRILIRDTSRIVISNPDGWHIYMTHHAKWEHFYRNLKVVVIDEAHLYSGVKGAHVAQVIRRLRRICNYYGSDPLFFLATATIANPVDHAHALTGLPDVHLINRSGAGSAKRIYLVLDAYTEGGGNRVLQMASDAVYKAAGEYPFQTICFAQSRSMVEKITSTAADQHPGLSIESYRAGYDGDLRAGKEHKLSHGLVRSIVTTSALEVGIDVGSLDVVISAGYPGTLASLRQQVGRVGRSGSAGLAVIILGSDPQSRYFATNPKELILGAPENATASTLNRYVVRDHIRVAASELPLDRHEPFVQESVASRSVFDALVRDQKIMVSPQGTYIAVNASGSPIAPTPLALKLSLGGISNSEVSIIDNSKTDVTVEVVSAERAITTLFPAAVHFHDGTSYAITHCDWPNSKLYATPLSTSDLHTDPVVVRSVRSIATGQIHAGVYARRLVQLSEVSLQNTLVGYKRTRRLISGESEVVTRKLTPQAVTLRSIGVSFALAGGSSSSGGQELFSPAVGHTLAQLFTNVAPLVAHCDPRDIVSIYSDDTVWVVDNRQGGSGVAEQVYARFSSLIRYAHKVLSSCGCTDGCPRCILGGRSNVGTVDMSKGETVKALAMLMALAAHDEAEAAKAAQHTLHAMGSAIGSQNSRPVVSLHIPVASAS